MQQRYETNLAIAYSTLIPSFDGNGFEGGSLAETAALRHGAGNLVVSVKVSLNTVAYAKT